MLDEHELAINKRKLARRPSRKGYELVRRTTERNRWECPRKTHKQDDCDSLSENGTPASIALGGSKPPLVDELLSPYYDRSF